MHISHDRTFIYLQFDKSDDFILNFNALKLCKLICNEMLIIKRGYAIETAGRSHIETYSFKFIV